MVRCFVTAYQVAMEMGRAKNPQLELTETASDHAVIRIRGSA